MVCELVSYRTVRVGMPSVSVAVGDTVQESAATRSPRPLGVHGHLQRHARGPLHRDTTGVGSG
jgi:hypothetical protein